MSPYTKPKFGKLFTFLLALIRRSNLVYVKSRSTFPSFFNFFLFLWNIVRRQNVVKCIIAVSSFLLTRWARSMQTSIILIPASQKTLNCFKDFFKGFMFLFCSRFWFLSRGVDYTAPIFCNSFQYRFNISKLLLEDSSFLASSLSRTVGA